MPLLALDSSDEEPWTVVPVVVLLEDAVDRTESSIGLVGAGVSAGSGVGGVQSAARSDGGVQALLSPAGNEEPGSSPISNGDEPESRCVAAASLALLPAAISAKIRD